MMQQISICYLKTIHRLINKTRNTKLIVICMLHPNIRVYDEYWLGYSRKKIQQQKSIYWYRFCVKPRLLYCALDKYTQNSFMSLLFAIYVTYTDQSSHKIRGELNHAFCGNKI